jgi:hypothetical protein
MHNDDTCLAIQCTACGASESKEIDWLHENTVWACSGCGTEIDLRQNPWKGEIQRLWNALHHLGPPRRRLP